IKAVNKMDKYEKLSSYLSLRLSTETTNSELLSLSSKIEDLYVEYQKHQIEEITFLKEIENLDELINSSDILKEHKYILKEAKEKALHTLSKDEENVIAKMGLNGGSLWTKQWKQITSTVEVSYKDKILTLPEVRNLAYEEDKNVRKEAYEAELKAYEKIDLPASFSLNGVKGEVIEIAKMRGFESPLAMTLEQSRLDKEVFNAMFDAIKEVLPKLQKYFLKKAEILGHKDGLPFYDLFAPVGKSNITFTYDEAKEYVYKNFSKFSKKLGEFAKTAFDNEWIDVYPRKGKVGGAFCHSIHSIKESRILTNFSGSLNDVLTLAHELGHGYHNFNLFDETYLNSEYSMPIAETASTLCESIIINSALEEATDDEKVVILENDLSGCLQCIVDIYSRFLFEDSVFEARKEGFVSKDELCKFMEDAQQKAYGKGLDKKYLHKYMWVCKPHYYYGDTNYYNFPYAYGTLFSKGLFALYLKDKESFIKNYDKMLSVTGKNDLYEVGKFIGVDVKSKEFWLSSLNLIIEDIEKYSKL
ncbi:MAG: M3 family oligoendopeptidase, partial [Eubacteriales bacterium]|nr:M3 family oligoendopeptidase [Eubacteriales bacterium]